ncbi:MAG: GyrI-like domain-containing protein [Deltaproteobacteria bacterium]|nr:GyrI-like domain-containing protein [Deltaproteobacteria bacterium]
MSHVHETHLPPLVGIGIRERLPVERLPAFFGSAFARLAQVAATGGARFTGPPFARYFSVADDQVDLEAVAPLDHPVPAEGRVHGVELPAGAAVEVVHVGPYDTLHEAHREIEAWLAEHHRRAVDAVREVYLTEPGSVPDPAEWRTLVVQPIDG